MTSPNLSLTNTNIESRSSLRLSDLLKVGTVALAALVAAGTYVDSLSRTDHVRVPEIVRPYDTDWSLVVRADKIAGINPDSVDIRPAVDRVAEQYGASLQPGKKVVVELDK